MHFFEVGGQLVRRTRRARQHEQAEVWHGNSWIPYASLESILRHGHRLTDVDAIALLRRSLTQAGPAIPSDQDIRKMLHHLSRRRAPQGSSE